MEEETEENQKKSSNRQKFTSLSVERELNPLWGGGKGNIFQLKNKTNFEIPACSFSHYSLLRRERRNAKTFTHTAGKRSGWRVHNERSCGSLAKIILL